MRVVLANAARLPVSIPREKLVVDEQRGQRNL